MQASGYLGGIKIGTFGTAGGLPGTAGGGGGGFTLMILLRTAGGGMFMPRESIICLICPTTKSCVYMIYDTCACICGHHVYIYIYVYECACTKEHAYIHSTKVMTSAWAAQLGSSAMLQLVLELTSMMISKVLELPSRAICMYMHLLYIYIYIYVHMHLCTIVCNNLFAELGKSIHVVHAVHIWTITCLLVNTVLNQ